MRNEHNHNFMHMTTMKNVQKFLLNLNLRRFSCVHIAIAIVFTICVCISIINKYYYLPPPNSIQENVPYPDPLEVCNYVNEAWPVIGPDFSTPCAVNHEYRALSEWYLADGDIHASQESVTQLNNTLSKAQKVLNDNGVVEFKSFDELHISFMYIGCQTLQEIDVILDNWNHIMCNDKLSIDWYNLEICFDNAKCVLDRPNGDTKFDLFATQESNAVFMDIITQVEEFIETEYNIELTFHRQRDQQPYHITLASVDGWTYASNTATEQLDDTFSANDWGCLKIGTIPKKPTKIRKFIHGSNSKENKGVYQWELERMVN